MSIALESLGRAVKQLQNRHHRQLDAQLAGIGSSLAQWDALRAIHRNPCATSHGLADYTFQTDQAFGTLAGRLLEKGLIERSAGKGRAVHYQLTAEGGEILGKGTAIAEAMLAHSFAPLDADQQQQLFDLLERVLDNPAP